MIRRFTSGSVLVLAALSGSAHSRNVHESTKADASAPKIDASGPMTHQKLQRYLSAFNRNDLSFAQFYTPDVKFYKMTEPMVGRDAAVAWYREWWSGIRETIKPLTVVIDCDGKVIMAELQLKLEAKRDGVGAYAGDSLNKGDIRVITSTYVYTLEDGLISSIRGAEEGATTIRASSGAASTLPPAPRREPGSKD